MSRTTWVCFSPTRAAIAAALSPEAPRRPAIRGTTSAASRTGASGTNTVPPSASSARSRASSIENRVLPAPPGPTIVTTRGSRSSQTRGSVEQLALTAQEVSGRGGEIDGSRRSQRWELRGAELKQPDGGVEVLESMTSEIPQRPISDERRGRGGDDHLAAVGERSDPSAAVDIDPDVALRGHGGCAGVQTHSHRDRPRRERPLPTGRSGDRAGGGRKGDEERIPRASTSIPPSATNASRSRRRCSASASP